MLFSEQNMFLEHEGYYYIPYAFINKRRALDILFYPTRIYNILKNNEFTIYNLFTNNNAIDIIKERYFTIISEEDSSLENILEYNHIINNFCPMMFLD